MGGRPPLPGDGVARRRGSLAAPAARAARHARRGGGRAEVRGGDGGRARARRDPPRPQAVQHLPAQRQGHGGQADRLRRGQAAGARRVPHRARSDHRHAALHGAGAGAGGANRRPRGRILPGLRALPPGHRAQRLRDGAHHRPARPPGDRGPAHRLERPLRRARAARPGGEPRHRAQARRPLRERRRAGPGARPRGHPQQRPTRHRQELFRGPQGRAAPHARRADLLGRGARGRHVRRGPLLRWSGSPGPQAAGHQRAARRRGGAVRPRRRQSRARGRRGRARRAGRGHALRGARRRAHGRGAGRRAIQGRRGDPRRPRGAHRLPLPDGHANDAWPRGARGGRRRPRRARPRQPRRPGARARRAPARAGRARHGAHRRLRRGRRRGTLHGPGGRSDGRGRRAAARGRGRLRGPPAPRARDADRGAREGDRPPARDLRGDGRGRHPARRARHRARRHRQEPRPLRSSWRAP